MWTSGGSREALCSSLCGFPGQPGGVLHSFSPAPTGDPSFPVRGLSTPQVRDCRAAPQGVPGGWTRPPSMNPGMPSTLSDAQERPQPGTRTPTLSSGVRWALTCRLWWRFWYHGRLSCGAPPSGGDIWRPPHWVRRWPVRTPGPSEHNRPQGIWGARPLRDSGPLHLPRRESSVWECGLYGWPFLQLWLSLLCPG